MQRRDYRTDLIKMNHSQLKSWIDRKTDLLIGIGEARGSTPLLNKIIYAKNLLKKKNTNK